MLLNSWFLAAALLVPVAGPADDELVQRAAVVKPTADELKCQQIAWVTDLTEGLKLARAERRPIFLWVTGDDPLERC